MAKKIGVTNLNASTIDILNTIRANAGYEYQNTVPEITKASEIPVVGDILYGYPALANQFINALVNRIALVKVKSATFNNAYAELKKGYLEFGETVEEVFVNISKAVPFNVDNASKNELKRTLPDVRTAFHVMNWRVQYPVTIQDQDLRQAFTSIDGVQDLIAKIVDSVYTASEYDEYLLFKYLMIKAITKGQMFPVTLPSEDMKEVASTFRGTSNQLTFMSNKYNASRVRTTTPKESQYIFMDSNFNAKFDVEVLASAFNMDKADFTGKLKLIDDWSTFDNERFSIIMQENDSIEEVTKDELALMKKVKAVLIDEEWFQVYDNNNKFTEKYVASGMYWNYFYNVWKTISSSPFSNAIVFVEAGVNTTDIASFKGVIDTVTKTPDETYIFNIIPTPQSVLKNQQIEFIQSKDLTSKGVAVHKYGTIIVPKKMKDTALTLTAKIGSATYEGTLSTPSSQTTGATISFTMKP